MFEEKLAVIIPTKNRLNSLSRLLESISLQELQPAQIIIVDGGIVRAEKVINRFSKLHIDYVKAPCSLTAQRNIGINLLKKEITLVAFFDDDIELFPHTLDIVMKFFSKAADDIAGVACNNISYPRNKSLFLEKLFLLGSDSVGVVLPSGFQSVICSVEEDYQVQWIAGCAAFWRRDIFNNYKFDEWFYGYGHCEDIDFSFRVSKEYKLFVLKDAKIIHKTNAIEKRYEYSLGKMQVVNRVYFVKKHAELSLGLSYWACTGLFLKNMFLGTVGLKPKYFLRGLGILTGIFVSFFKHKRIKEKIKL